MWYHWQHRGEPGQQSPYSVQKCWFNYVLGKEFSLLESIQTGSGSHQWVLGSLFLWLNGPLSSPSAKVKNAWNYTSTLLYRFMVWYLNKYRDNFTFHLQNVSLSITHACTHARTHSRMTTTVKEGLCRSEFVSLKYRKTLLVNFISHFIMNKDKRVNWLD